MKTSTLIERFLTWAEKHYTKPNFDRRRYLIADFRAAHGHRLVSRLRRYHLTEWIDSHATWLSPWTRLTAVKTVQVAFGWGVREGHIKSNPFAGHRARSGSPRRPITEAEYRALLRATADTQRPYEGAGFRRLLVFLRYSSARPGEAIRLKKQHVDYERGLAILREHKTSAMLAEPSPRVIVLHPVAVKLLRWIERHEPGATEGLYFRTADRTPWKRQSVATRLRRLRKRAGIADDVVLYGFRHAFCYRALRAGLDFKTTSLLMGHSDCRMTEHYASSLGVAYDHLHAAMEKAGRAV